MPRDAQTALRAWLALPVARRREVVRSLRDDVDALLDDGSEPARHLAELLEIGADLLDSIAQGDLYEHDVEQRTGRNGTQAGLHLVRIVHRGEPLVAEAASVPDALHALARRIERRSA